MGCKFYGGDGAMIVLCDRGPKPKCDECWGNADHVCVFPFAGKKQGQTCGKPLCVKCSHTVEVSRLPTGFNYTGEGDTIPLCPAHSRFVERKRGEK